jgi:AAA domain, putative AbiEii toxin, Type IV TA system
MRAIRRVGGQLQIPTDPIGYRSIWEDLFFDFKTENKIEIQIKGSSGDQRQLKISFKDALQQEIPFGKDLENSVGLPQIVFRWKRGGGREIVIKPTVKATGLDVGNLIVDNFPLIWFHPAGTETPDLTAKRYSELSKRNQTSPIVEALKSEFDFIEDISIEFLSGVPMLFASIKERSQKVPVGLVSDGVNRLISILLGIAYYKTGVVLIDQLEDGFYFDHFPSIWRLIHSFAVKYKTQLFVSTHSRECLKAISPTLEINKNDFRLLRAERSEKNCTVEQFDGDTLLAGLQEQVEFR